MEMQINKSNFIGTSVLVILLLSIFTVVFLMQDGKSFTMYDRMHQGTVVVYNVTGNVDPTTQTPLVGLGTGFFIAPNVIITNEHVIHDNKQIFIRGYNSPGRWKATVVKSDVNADLAIIKIDDWKSYLQSNDYVVFSFNNNFNVGDSIFALGHPEGHDWSLSHGIISSTERLPVDGNPTGVDDVLLQIDVMLSPGNSGGPLFSKDGRIIGMNEEIQIVQGGSLKFAIDGRFIQKAVRDLLKDGKINTPALGIKFGFNPSINQISIGEIEKGSNAEKAGLLKDDVLVGIQTKYTNGFEHIREPDTLVANVKLLDFGDVVSLNIMRNGKPMTININLTS